MKHNIYIRSSTLAKAYCPAAFFMASEANSANKDSTISYFVTGSVIHAFIDQFHKNKGAVDLMTFAMQLPLEDQVVGSQLLANYHRSAAAKLTPLVTEKPFEFFLTETNNYRVSLKGQLDMLAVVNGLPCIIDTKTTRKSDPLKVMMSYLTSSQFSFYGMVITQYGHLFLPDDFMNLVKEKGIHLLINLGLLYAKDPAWRLSKPYLLDSIRLTRTKEAVDFFTASLDNYQLYRLGMLNNSCPNCDYKERCLNENNKS